VSVRAILKRARAAVADGERDLYAAIERHAKGDAAADTLDALEASATPAWARCKRAILRWAESQDNADGLRAVELAKAPGAAVTLDVWLDQRRGRGWKGVRVELLAAFDRAILERTKQGDR
jgi:hypothetical protein